MTVGEIAAAVQAGRMTAETVLEAHVSRHDVTHAALNALIQPQFAAARKHARCVVGGPLAGVPVSVKECFPVRGLKTTLGIPARCHQVDTHDADIVTRLRSAGAIVVGKANVSQAMYLHETDNPVWGRTSHPADPERNPGGSSGGDAALVAAGVVPLAVGTDLAGSIRQPAHACGVAGIMPRSATLGDGGGFDTMPHLRIVRPRAGFLARQVGDLRLALAACSGQAYSIDPRPALRIAWFDACGPLDPSPAVRRAVSTAAEWLESTGAVVTRIEGSLWAEAAWLHLAILSADGGRAVRGLFGGSQPMPEIAWLLRLAGLPRWARPSLAAVARIGGRRIEGLALGRTGPRSSADAAALESARDGMRGRLAELSTAYDAVVCPVSALPALRHGTASRLLVAAAPCLAANLFDLPAGAVPVTTVREGEQSGRQASRDPVTVAAADADRGSVGLPVGVQVVGLRQKPGEGEGVVLAVMERIERSRPHRPS